jgi:hypothetical protein
MPSGNLYYSLNSDALQTSIFAIDPIHIILMVSAGQPCWPDGSFNRDSGKFSTDFYSLNYTIGKRIDKTNTIDNHYSTHWH